MFWTPNELSRLFTVDSDWPLPPSVLSLLAIGPNARTSLFPDESKMAFAEERWQRAFDEVKSQFGLANLLPEQETSIRAFFEGNNVFVNLPTIPGFSSDAAQANVHGDERLSMEVTPNTYFCGDKNQSVCELRLQCAWSIGTAELSI